MWEIICKSGECWHGWEGVKEGCGITVSNMHYINVCNSQRIHLIKMRTIVALNNNKINNK